MERWAGVIRVSHMGARKAGDADVHTDREQDETIRGEAKRMGVTVDVLKPELDVKGSWTLDRRPALREAVEGVESGRYAGIIVAYLSRLGRNTRQQLEVWDRVEKAGGRIIVVRERIDTSTPSGRMTRTILSAVDERELEEHVERFANLREWATTAGIWQRRQTPRGYSKDPDTRKLVPDGQRDDVRYAFLARGRGDSFPSIGNKIGMTPGGVRALIANRVYLGELRVGEHVNPDAHPPLVTPDEFAAANARNGAARPGRANGSPALLAGLARCASCGHVMTRVTSGSHKKRYYSYLCPRHHSAGRCPTPAGIKMERLDEHVEAIALAELAKLATAASRNGHDLATARAKVATAQGELDAYLAGVAAASLTTQQWADGARARREAIDAATADLERMLEQSRALVDGDPVVAWGEWDSRRRNHVLRGLLDCVIVRPTGRGRVVPVADRTRVIAHGASLARRYSGGGVAMPVEEMLWPDADSPVVLGMVSSEHLADGASG